MNKKRMKNIENKNCYLIKTITGNFYTTDFCCIGLFLCACIIAIFIKAWFVLEEFVNDMF